MSERLVKKVNVVGKGSLSLIVPKRWADALGIKPGTRVSLYFDGSKITVMPTTGNDREEEVNVLIEPESHNLAIRKLVASYVEGVTRVKIKASYDQTLELSESLKDYVTSFVLMANPDSAVHELAFSDVKTDLLSILKTLEATSSKLLECFEEQDPSISVNYREFYRKYLYFLRSVKQSVAVGFLDPYEALDLVVSVEYIKELFDFLVAAEQGRPREDHDLPKMLELTRTAINAVLVQDVETAVNTVIRVLSLLEGIVCSSELCRNIKYLTARISEVILGRCVRNKACRCKYFFPKI